jgi:hypothetical protein
MIVLLFILCVLFYLLALVFSQICKNEKDDDSSTRRKEMELAEEEDFGNSLVSKLQNSQQLGQQFGRQELHGPYRGENSLLGNS